MDSEIADSEPLFVDHSNRMWTAYEIESDPDSDMDRQIDRLQILDDAPAFVELINNLPSDYIEEVNGICDGLFSWDSAKCAAAIIDGQITRLPLANDLLSSIHMAAGTNCFKIVDMMLQMGFSADVRGCCYDLHTFENQLPLHAVLSRQCIWGEDKHSAASSIVQLCSQMRRRTLETTRIVAPNTTEIKREFFNYLKEGQIFPVAALLMVAKSSILSPSTAIGEGEFRSISEVHDFVLNTKNNKLEMKETLVFLEILQILDKIGDKLSRLLRHDFTQTCLAYSSKLLIASVIEDAGFDIKAINFDANRPSSRSVVESKLLTRSIDECEKTICTTDILPSWVKQAALRGLRDKSGSTTHLTYQFLDRAIMYMENVSVSPLTPGSSSAMPENKTPLHHLLNKTAPLWGTIKRVFRRRLLLR